MKKGFKEGMFENEGQMIGPLGEKVIEAVLFNAPKGCKEIEAHVGDLVNRKSNEEFSLIIKLVKNEEGNKVERGHVVYDKVNKMKIVDIINKFEEEVGECDCLGCKLKRAVEGLKEMSKKDYTSEDITSLIKKTFDENKSQGDA